MKKKRKIEKKENEKKRRGMMKGKIVRGEAEFKRAPTETICISLENKSQLHIFICSLLALSWLESLV